MKMRLKDGKKKVLTLSYDDGAVQDIKLCEILDKYGIRATFNINSGMFVSEDKEREQFIGRMKLSEAKKLYIGSNHEIACHTLTHPFLDKLDTTEMIYEIIEDRKNIEREFGCIARGMAYPFGAHSLTVSDVLSKCGICYSRTTNSTLRFSFPDNWLYLNPTCHHKNEKLMELANKFVTEDIAWGNAEMFYLWGHSYEFNSDNNWNVIEEFSKTVSGRDDIWYATNIEIYDYVKAYRSLYTSYDKSIIHNPSSLDVWAEIDGETVCIKSGQTLKLK